MPRATTDDLLDADAAAGEILTKYGKPDTDKRLRDLLAFAYLDGRRAGLIEGRDLANEAFDRLVKDVIA